MRGSESSGGDQFPYQIPECARLEMETRSCQVSEEEAMKWDWRKTSLRSHTGWALQNEKTRRDRGRRKKEGRKRAFNSTKTI